MKPIFSNCIHFREGVNEKNEKVFACFQAILHKGIDCANECPRLFDYGCVFCDKIFKSYYGLFKHVRYEHSTTLETYAVIKKSLSSVGRKWDDIRDGDPDPLDFAKDDFEKAKESKINYRNHKGTGSTPS
jgi:hypothetical protein